MTRGDFRHPRLLVNPALSARLPAEVFHRVRDVHRRAVDARCFECAVENASSGTDEWLTRPIFFIARLLANEHDRRMRWSGTEDCLRGTTPEITALALGSGSLCRRKRRMNWHERPG